MASSRTAGSSRAEPLLVEEGVVLLPFDPRPTQATLDAWAPEIKKVQERYRQLVAAKAKDGGSKRSR